MNTDHEQTSALRAVDETRAGRELYAIRALPLRDQLRDTYRVLFFPVALGIATVVFALLHVSEFILLGAGLGMLPSLRLGTPSRMTIAPGDSAPIDAWLASHLHVLDERGWVPKFPRALYFDSQIVRHEGDTVVGPLITLRKLRTLLQPPKLAA